MYLSFFHLRLANASHACCSIAGKSLRNNGVAHWELPCVAGTADVLVMDTQSVQSRSRTRAKLKFLLWLTPDWHLAAAL